MYFGHFIIVLPVLTLLSPTSLFVFIPLHLSAPYPPTVALLMIFHMDPFYSFPVGTLSPRLGQH